MGHNSIEEVLSLAIVPTTGDRNAFITGRVKSILVLDALSLPDDRNQQDRFLLLRADIGHCRVGSSEYPWTPQLLVPGPNLVPLR